MITLVYDSQGNPVDSLAVATDDMLMTGLVRVDLLDDDSLSWLAKRCLAHAEETKDEPVAKVYLAIKEYIEKVQQDD